jgi:hypothetical protein
MNATIRPLDTTTDFPNGKLGRTDRRIRLFDIDTFIPIVFRLLFDLLQEGQIYGLEGSRSL